ncbi:TRAP transporter substrate-binding protein [bacterium LRH843]|nr:TRAP transporter substrate-binding protein [bacterium LRH843]
MRKLLLGLVSIFTLGIAAGCNQTEQVDVSSDKNVEAETYHIKLGHVLDSRHPYHLGAEKWKELIEEKSEGRIKIDLFHSSQIGGESQLQEGMRGNTIQAAIIGSTLGMLDSAFYVNDLPYVYDTAEEAHKKLDGELGTELFSRLDAKGLKGLAWWEQGYRNVSTTNKPVHKPEDLKGLKIRVPETHTYIDTFNVLGANAITIPFAELFTALESKVVDGQENPIAQIYTSKLYEVQNHVSLTEHFYGTAALVISLDFYNSLPDDLKKIVDEASIEARDYEREQSAIQSKEFIAELKAAGVNVIEDIDKEAFKEATKSVIEMNEEAIGKDILELLRK